MIPLFTFFISLLAIVSFLAWRLHQIRSGKKDVSPTEHEKSKLAYHIDVLEQHVIRYTKEYGHRSIVFALKTYVIASHLFGKRFKEAQTWMISKMTKKSDAEGRESTFLKTIGDYKKRVQIFKETLKENDKNDEE